MKGRPFEGFCRITENPIPAWAAMVSILCKRVEFDKACFCTEPFLNALDQTDFYCEGTAFYALQSCVNHSCCPNAHAFKRDEDVPATCVLLAKEPIRKGEEILISYIDENEDFISRTLALKDYGFTCQCPKCLAESQ